MSASSVSCAGSIVKLGNEPLSVLSATDWGFMDTLLTQTPVLRLVVLNVTQSKAGSTHGHGWTVRLTKLFSSLSEDMFCTEAAVRPKV